MSIYYFDAAILAALAFVVYQLVTIGRSLMSTQDVIDAVVVQLGKAKDEIVAKIYAVQEQLDDAGVTAEEVDLSALTAAAQALDDVVPDAAVVVPDPEPVVEEPVVEEPVLVDFPDQPGDPVDAPVE